MFQLVLVDDRKDVVQGIAAALDWEKMGVKVICFYNGRDARDHIMEHPVDMVISDIRMPYMNGLELAKEVLARYPQIRFVLLTGYDEFAYAREAIHLGIVEYLSKPVKIEEIRELVKREVKRAEELKCNVLSQQDIRLRYNRSLPLIKTHWIHEFLRGNENREEAVEEKLREFGTELDIKYIFAVLMEVDQGQDRDELMQYALENIGKEILSEEHPCEAFCLESGRVLFLISYSEETNKSYRYYQLYQPLLRIQSAFSDYFHQTVSMGIGDFEEGTEGIRRSFLQAEKALAYKFYLGNNKIISTMDLPADEAGQKNDYPHALEQQVIAAVRDKDPQAGGYFKKYFEELRSLKGVAPERFRDILVEFLLQLCSQCAGEATFQMVDVLEKFRSRKTLDDMQNWFQELIEKAAAAKEEEDTSDIQRCVRKVREYMDEHYMENITLKKMADYVYLSPSYLSFSFKEIIHINFNEYLGRVRIEKAKELLASSDYRVYEVCSMVGYSDKKYFTELFRRYTGMLPKEWARKEKKDDLGIRDTGKTGSEA